MVITAIQAILIAFAVGLIVGAVVGWKFTFNMRLARIQEQQVTINKLKEKLAAANAELRTIKYQKTKENVSNAAVAVGQTAVAAGGAVGNAAVSLKDRIFGGKKDKKDKKDKKKDVKALKDSSGGHMQLH